MRFVPLHQSSFARIGILLVAKNYARLGYELPGLYLHNYTRNLIYSGMNLAVNNSWTSIEPLMICDYALAIMQYDV